MSFVSAAFLITAGVTAAASTAGAVSAQNSKKRAEAEERRSRVEMDRLKSDYMSLDTSNPYANMENTMEDLTVNQQQAQFQGQQFQQSQANVLDATRGVAGGSGIAALAQSMVQQGQSAAQKASATIGQQESQNQASAASQAAVLQSKEREGDIKSRDWERDQVGTALGMSQAETAAAREEAMLAEQAKWDSIQGGVEGLGNVVAAGV